MPRRSGIALLLLAACSKHAPKQIATLPGDANAAAIDATSIYVAVSDLGTARIIRVPRAGGAAPEEIASPAELVSAMALAPAGDALILGDISIEDDGHPLVVNGATIKDPEALAAAAAVGTKHTGVLARLQLADHTLSRIATFDGTPNEMVVDASTAYVASIGVFEDATLETDGTGAIVALDLAHPGEVRQLAKGLTVPENLAVDATSIYFSDRRGRWRVPKAGGAVEAVTTSPPPPVERARSTLVLKDAAGTVTIDSTGTDTRVLVD